jgi:hypothetical protein
MAVVEPVSAASAQAQVQVQVHARTPQREDPGLSVGTGAMLRGLTVGSQLSGVVVGATDGRLQVAIERGLLTLEGAGPLPPGTRVVVQITAVQPQLQGTLRLAAAPPAPTPTATPPAPTPTAAPPGVVITAPAAGDADAPGLTTLLTPVLEDGQVGNDGQPEARPAAAHLATSGQPTEGAAQPAAAVPRLSGAAVLRGERWPALEAALALPVETSAAIRAALPQADPTLARHLQAMAAAARMRDPRIWPGTAACADLARQRPDLLAALVRDLGEIAPRAEGTAGEEWVGFGLPLLVGAEVAPVRLLFRDAAGDRRRQRRGSDQRVLVDLTLSRLGRVQIDMLIHGSLAMLDVAVRSEQPFPPAVRDEIRALVRDAVGGVDVVGSIDFQSAPSRFVEVMVSQGDRPDGVIV